MVSRRTGPISIAMCSSYCTRITQHAAPEKHGWNIKLIPRQKSRYKREERDRRERERERERVKHIFWGALLLVAEFATYHEETFNRPVDRIQHHKLSAVGRSENGEEQIKTVRVEGEKGRRRMESAQKIKPGREVFRRGRIEHLGVRRRMVWRRACAVNYPY